MNIDQTDTIETIPWKKSLLVLFPAMWMLFHITIVSKGIVMPETIGEAMGGSLVILILPMIPTSIVYIVKKVKSVPYVNFVKHTFISTSIFFILAIASVFNT